MARSRTLFAPEIVQSSAMDCGPASLKCLLEGHGIPVGYGRLREACQTDVDGTSIDVLEDVACQLGLDAEQIVIPPDHVALPAAGSLPALAVVRLPSGATHFVVIWRKVGGLVQVMDPGTGRRYVTVASLRAELYRHEMPVPADAWREWAGSEPFLSPLAARLRGIGFRQGAARRLISRASEDPSWRSLAALDGAARMTASLVEAGAVRRGGSARGLAEELHRQGALGAEDPDGPIPDAFWSVRPAPPAPSDEPGDGGREEADAPEEAELLLRGAVLLKVKGRRTGPFVPEDGGAPPPLSPELAAALAEPKESPLREIARIVREDGLGAPCLVAVMLAVLSAAAALEAIIFRGLIDIGRDLATPLQRGAGLGVLVAFLLVLLVIELPMAAALLRIGRRLEVRLRAAFLRKLPRLGDRYFESRLRSDMAERGHSLHALRGLPTLFGAGIRAGASLLVTALALIWIDPAGAPLVVFASLVSLATPLLVHQRLAGVDLRLRTHAGALTRFYLDALRGLAAVRAHGAERALEREHEALLTEWMRAGVGLQRAAVGAEALVRIVGFTLVAALVLGRFERGGDTGALLLTTYWALQLPAFGTQLAQAVRQLPQVRSIVLRLLEPLGAPEDGVEEPSPAPRGVEGREGMSLRFDRLTVVAGGHTILSEVEADIAAGEMVGIVGPSGAGKSSLVGVLLGWHRPSAGSVLVDGEPLTAARLGRLREETAWVDPAVHVFDRTLLENLRYGSPDGSLGRLGLALEAARLRELVQRLPDGLQTRLGESGGLVSGGEGQRVRLGRGILRPGVRLVILDEPFRGLDGGARRALLRAAREAWPGATILCITHDVGDTLELDRVLVIDRGRLAEDARPAELAERETSRYRALLELERDVKENLWRSSRFRHLHLEGGTLAERAAVEAGSTTLGAEASR